MKIRTVLVPIFALVVAASLAQAQVTRSGAAFEEARRLIEANCGDCLDSSRESLEKGIALVRTTIPGAVDRVPALLLLAEGLNTLQHVFSVPDSEHQKAVGAERRRILDELVTLRPNDAAIAYMRAGMLSDRKEQLAAYGEVIRLAPRHAGASYATGMIKMEFGLTDEAILWLTRAVENANTLEAETYGRRLIDILEQAGRTDEIDAVRSLIKKKMP